MKSFTRVTVLIVAVAVLLGIGGIAQAALLSTLDADLAASNSDLLQTQLESVLVSNPDRFTDAGATGGEPSLRDGTTLNPKVVGVGGLAGISSGAFVEYTLDTTVNTLGYDLTRVDVFHGWVDGGRDDSLFDVSFSTVAAPDTFNTLFSGASFSAPSNYGRTSVVTELADLATAVKKVRIDFPDQENATAGYSEIDVLGQVTIPEPSTFVLAAIGLFGLLLWVRCRRN